MNIREIYKALTAGATALAGFEGFAAALDATSSHPWVHAVAVGVSTVVGVATWFIRNKATFDQIVQSLDEDPVLEERVTTQVVEKAIESSPDLVEDLIARYRERN